MSGESLSTLVPGKAVGAILGSAFGDALGWPNERVGRQKKANIHSPISDFQVWRRYSGGAFYSHKETIEAGEYSDDTQLILAVSRSLLHGKSWWEYFSQVELPFWTTYERGGGGATKRSANAWLASVSPWAAARKSQDIRQYFEAGGNGVAMRILPHVLHNHRAKDFSNIALNIMLDGICTHGHPRALLGALFFGYAAWWLLQNSSRLVYGELVDHLISNSESWSILPVQSDILSRWIGIAEGNLKNYRQIWNVVKNELLDYLQIAKTEIAKGTLCFDNEVLSRLDCFNKQISGAGSVSAISSIFLASRYAADPMNGVIKAAYAIGADTDTLACMTGSLLGCINGKEWLSGVKNAIQDCAYLEAIALDLVHCRNNREQKIKSVTKSSLKGWVERMFLAPTDSLVELPDGQKAKVAIFDHLISNSGTNYIYVRKLTTEAGQSIFVKKITKGKPEDIPKVEPSASQKMLFQDSKIICAKLPVLSFEKSIAFYKECLGFTVKKQTKDVVEFHQGLILVPNVYVRQLGKTFCSLLHLEVTDIDKRYEYFKDREHLIVSPIGSFGVGYSKKKCFKCYDPDRNVIEVFG